MLCTRPSSCFKGDDALLRHRLVEETDVARALDAGDEMTCYITSMNAEVRTMLARVEHWPEEDQEELAQIALEIEARRHGVYHATPEELQAIDEALAAVGRGEVASDEEVEAVFAKYRRK
jgi:hypothetical protein